MRNLLILILVSAALLSKAQNPMFRIDRIELINNSDSMKVVYTLFGQSVASGVHLKVTDKKGKAIKALSFSGHVGDSISPGKDKTIIWDMAADSLDLSGSQLMVQVSGKLFVETFKKKRELWIPWLYIASGISAATGVYAHFRAEHIYDNDYLPSWQTPGAESFNKKIRNLETVRDVAFGTAGVLGALGVVVHIRHNQKVHALNLNYRPQPDGAEIKLSYNF